MSAFSSLFSRYPAVFIFVFDIIAIGTASLLAFLLRYDGVIPVDRFEGFLIFTALAIVTTPFLFYLFRLYQVSFMYVSLTDLPAIAKAAAGSMLLLGTLLYIFRTFDAFSDFARSIIFLYGILLFLGAVLVRFYRRMYWQLFRAKKVSSSELEKQPLSFFNSKTTETAPIQKVLITGGAGYIGSVLVGQLLSAGYKVKVYDKLLFGAESLSEFSESANFELVQGDILDKPAFEKAIVDVDAVVHLAAIVGEAACAASKDVALEVNYLGTVQVARLCKAYGIQRFIYFSTCSTYGKSAWDEVVTERSTLRPVDFYGETKIYAERELMRLADENFLPTILRLSTVYGLSPRMRFDLVVNTLTKKAILEKVITIFGGDQWRPLVHVQDVARAIVTVLQAPLSRVGGQVFNIGGNAENYVVSDLGKLVREEISDVELQSIDALADKRSYKVGFDKARKQLGFEVQKTVRDGIREIKAAFEKGKFPDADASIYYNHRAGEK